MKLTKKNIYINLQGKSKDELTDLWEFLTSNGEIVSDTKEYFVETHLKYNNSFIALGSDNAWKWWGSYNKTEVTINELKEIIKPIGTLQQQLQKAEAEVKRLQSLIEEENKIKIGDWALELHSNNIIKATENSSILYLNSKEYCKKITNTELIKLLEDEIK